MLHDLRKERSLPFRGRHLGPSVPFVSGTQAGWNLLRLMHDGRDYAGCTKVPFCRSRRAWRISSLVFMTKGP